MTGAARAAPPRRPAAGAGAGRMLTFGGAGWVLLLAGLIAVGLVVFWVVPIVRHPRARATGDGRRVESYGFDLAALRVPRAALVASGVPKDGLPALDAPEVFPGREIEAFNVAQKKARVGAYLYGPDDVIGVAVNGEARAYPVRILSWHEVANDVLGGVPIAVTYSPLGDAAVVFERPLVDGRPVTFGVTGLLYNSNTLVYDRAPGGTVGAGGAAGTADAAGGTSHKESLWAPLRLAAIAGPAAAAGATLTPVPCQLTRWDTWLARYPESTVLKPNPIYAKRYKKEPYRSYYGYDTLRFPTVPAPVEDGRPLKQPLVILSANGAVRPVALADAAREASEGVYRTEVGGRAVRLLLRGDPPSAYVEAEDGGPPPVLAWVFRFAWETTRP